MKQFLPMLISNLDDYFGVKMTENQLEPIVRGDQPLMEMLFEIYSDTDLVNNHLMATQDRDKLADVVARDLTGMAWPMYGDAPEYQQSFVDAMNKAVADGRIIAFDE